MEATGAPGDAASMLKIIGSEIQQALQALTVEAVAYYALPFDVALIRGEINEPPIGPKYAESAVSDMNFGRAASIYGGSNEIQRNVIAKGVLGLINLTSAPLCIATVYLAKKSRLTKPALWFCDQPFRLAPPTQLDPSRNLLPFKSHT